VVESAPEPCRISLLVEGETHPAVALELTGHRAAIRSRTPLVPEDHVSLGIDWPSGSHTTLPARVRAVAPISGEQSVAHVDLCGVEGDWRAFLEYLGPLALAS
jgi:hypothetical protein